MFTFNPNPRPAFWERFGFAFHSQTNDFGAFRQAVTGLTLPLWSVVVVTAIPVVLAAAGVLRQRRARARHAGGFCGACGYDLRASTSRCPECGTPIPAEAKG